VVWALICSSRVEVDKRGGLPRKQSGIYTTGKYGVQELNG
jgi:hypothetical protein